MRESAKLCRLEIPVETIESTDGVDKVFGDALPVFGLADCDYSPGTPDQAGARLALGSLQAATKLAINGEVCAIATAPVAKSQLAKVGFNYPGQTEFLADSCKLQEQDAVMMLAGPQLRTIPLTVHCALAEVPGMLSIDLICHRAVIASRALQRDFGIENPRIAIAGLNPHAGEDGKFGDEDQRIIAPAIDTLRRQGIDVSGPHPADAMFSPHKRASYDVALCMYHDQALIPVKALDFDQGVNVTLGLPIIRTSPDHGTAFDIAGKAVANPSAMIAAIKMAGDCAKRRTSSDANG